MSNLIIWAYQATVDYNYRVGRDLSRRIADILEANLLAKAKALLTEARDKGLSSDRKLTVTYYPNMPDELDRIHKLLKQNGYPPEIQIGGDPAISAIRGRLLSLGPATTDLPEVWYAGLYPKSVEEVLTNNQVSEAREVEKVFRPELRHPVEEKPQSAGLEADVHKLIIIYGPGRSISLLAPDGTFQDFFRKIESELKRITPPKERVVLAISVSQPGLVRVDNSNAFDQLDQVAKEAFQEEDEYLPGGDKLYPKMVQHEAKEVFDMIFLLRLLRDVKQTPFGDRVRTFVATRDFRNPETGELDRDFVRATLRVFKEADIISVNDAEIHDLHTTYRGDFLPIPLAYKLRELPFKAIKVCHSADGVIMDLGCRPEHIITSDRFQKDPAGFLEEVLRLSADGATYAMDATAGLGRSANEAMIRIYSQNVRDESRQHEAFRATFLEITEPMPAGMISIASARVVRTLGAVVGLGAVFDGLLLSFLMRS